MASLLERLTGDLKDAMRAADALRRDEIRGFIAQLKAEQQAKLTRTLSKQGLILRGDNAALSAAQQTQIDQLRGSVPLSDDEEQAALATAGTQARQSLQAFLRGTRDAL